MPSSNDADLSVQLYTVRTALADDFVGTLGRLAEIGFTRVEPFAFVAFADQLREGLAAHGLAAPTAHVGLLSGNQDEIFALAKELGIETVIDPFVDPARWQDAKEIASIAHQLNAAAEKAAELGLRVGYHNHWFELESSFDGKHGLEVLADNLAPEVVLEVDTYWAYVGGADVPALLGRLGDRVVAVHVKDGDGTRNTKKQVPAGSGVVPIWDILDATPAAALRVIEFDDSEGDLVDGVAASRAYLLAGKGA